ncbi:hypothetical protein OSB04_019314 [Centaurea solstitialis]|uniref:SWIM-type domain-containing protein n=1 Tax=Centaurea solstitialis TaxID=347529 RepID=A0AA38WFS2_9ASTR|nr:hypothetical protein OSB04_019314 [Centaurea solstitialis]
MQDDVLNNEMGDYYNNTDDEGMEERVEYLKKLRAERGSNAKKDCAINFYVGQVFGSKYGIKKMIDTLAIETRRQIVLVKNDACRIRNVRACTATFLSQQIEETLAANPEIPIKSLQVTLEQKYENNISHMKSFRAKQIAMKKLMGDYIEQYTVLRDYICELQRTNPGTTVKLDVETDGLLSNETRQFKRIYVCLGALKKGFAEGKREILGLDGAFMKGPFPCQVLTVVGMDSNNGTYPLAYAIVEAETKQSWSWFLECLGDDLNLAANSNFTFISDRQKGFIPALANIFPCVEHRHCVRHIQQNMKQILESGIPLPKKNMKQKWKGKVYSDYLWKCAAACTVEEFTVNMEEFKAFDADAHKWLKQIPPKHWSKSHFTGRCHSDVLLNNMCEVFNNQLVNGRDKPIITALEYTRQYLMKRIVNVQKLAEKEDGPLTPTIADKLKEIKAEATKYQVQWNGADEYQVSGPHRYQCVVNMRKKTRACRSWELTGIPCKHVVSAIWNIAVNGLDVGIVENWVDPVYWLKTWKAMYSFKISPINGRKLWPKFGCPSIITTPKHHTQVGRPKKKRKKSVDEACEAANSGTKNKLRRIGKTVTCGKCNNKGYCFGFGCIKATVLVTVVGCIKGWTGLGDGTKMMMGRCCCCRKHWAEDKHDGPQFMMAAL